jgi:hypothetical protein
MRSLSMVTGQVALVPLAPDIFSDQLALGPLAVRFSGQLAPNDLSTFYKCTKVSREFFLTASVDDTCLQ